MIVPRVFLTGISYFKKIQDLHNMQCVLLSALSNCQHIFALVFFFWLVFFFFWFCFLGFFVIFFQIDNFCVLFLKTLVMVVNEQLSVLRTQMKSSPSPEIWRRWPYIH